MTLRRRALLLSACMAGASSAAALLRQQASGGRRSVPPELARHVPMLLSGWHTVDLPPSVVNPQTQQILDQLYSEVLTRVYVDAQGYHVMLSMAYGSDQRGGLEAHRPEVCYPAQGFTLHEQHDATVATTHGSIPVRRLLTTLGARVEPITYWFAMAQSVNASALERRMVRLRTLLTGAIPDGILLRVSSIDPDATRAYARQAIFVGALLDAMPSATRDRLLGRPMADPLDALPWRDAKA